MSKPKQLNIDGSYIEKHTTTFTSNLFCQLNFADIIPCPILDPISFALDFDDPKSSSPFYIGLHEAMLASMSRRISDPLQTNLANQLLLALKKDLQK